MAELSTIARPYAVGLMEALQERKASAQDMSAVLDAVSRLKRPGEASLLGTSSLALPADP